MALQLKRIYEAPAASDGQRIFVDRLWARGISKERAALTDWDKEIAPSAELRKQFGHDPEKFPAFKREYERELATNEMTNAFIEKIRAGLAAGNVTLLFGAKDEEHNNAVVLKEFIEAYLTK